MKKTQASMANYEEVKPLIESTAKELNVNPSQLSLMMGKSKRYLSSIAITGITDGAKNKILLILRGLSPSNKQIEELKAEIESLKKKHEKDIADYDHAISGMTEKSLLKDIVIGELCDREKEYKKSSNHDFGLLYKDKIDYQMANLKLKDKLFFSEHYVRLSFFCGAMSLIAFCGFIFSIRCILYGMSFNPLWFANVISMFVFACLYDDMINDLEV